MSDTIEVRVPDIGDFNDVPVIEVLVKTGDRVKKNDSLITLESEKASMEVPAESEGVVQDVKVKVGDKVSQGTPILVLSSGAAETAKAPEVATASETAKVSSAAAASAAPATIEVRVPDIGDFKDVPVIEVLVKAGDRVKKNDSLITLESEKASMEVPAQADGIVQDVKVKVGDKVAAGTPILVLSSLQAAQPAAQPQRAAAPSAQPVTPPPQRTEAPSAQPPAATGFVHAGPSVRRYARELGVELQRMRGTGPNGRVTREDVQGFVKGALQRGGGDGAPAFAGLPAWPKLDFEQYGTVERRALSRIKRLSGPNLHRNWVGIPHITNYDEADVTSIEALRSEVNAEQAKSGGPKLTMLAFLIRASVAALQRFPEFNASLDGQELILKRYYNIGFAADTPDGLIVPVIKNADTKGLIEIAREAQELAGKAREGKLTLGQMQGGSFTISSIGGIGGTAFTQIVNAPEVAILGATRAATKPVWDGKQFVPRLLLPISVSYDHRVVDGAGAARFLVYIAELLADFRRVML
ncbi:MAG TPA: dihydrolipoyllysine-residue acetyltransferase [Candidatus Acidoferrales bacterium]|jgi:pyruvate dehydrogenase E2 component (dihydrolipoamide acetyltransferase)|nr:dihydrolipoyllysine-residue acetyltransferase [Candidatus Acidoferrales bacterium]